MPKHSVALAQAPQAPATPQPSVAPPTPTAPPASWHYDCEGQQAAVEAATAATLGTNAPFANFIFSHESCEDPGRLNSEGAKGLGQALGHTDFTCGPDDINCQITWFTNYANAAYGGWYNAYLFWLGHNLW